VRKTSLLACPFFLLSDDDEEQKQKGHETEQQPSSSLLPSVRCLFLPPRFGAVLRRAGGEKRDTGSLETLLLLFYLKKRLGPLGVFFRFYDLICESK
jgi:hypothetical protein